MSKRRKRWALLRKFPIYIIRTKGCSYKNRKKRSYREYVTTKYRVDNGMISFKTKQKQYIVLSLTDVQIITKKFTHLRSEQIGK